MRIKTSIFVLFSIFIWSFIVYNLISDNSISMKNKTKSSYSTKIIKLEDELNQLILANKKLIGTIKLNGSTIDSNNDKVNKPYKSTTQLKQESLDYADTGIKTHLKYPINSNSFVNNKQIVKNIKDAPPAIPILVITCNRVTVKRCLDQLLKYRPSAEQFPIIVSQDCGHSKTAEVLSSYGNKIIYMRHPDLSDIEVPPQENKFKGYFKIARHYKWALNQVFFEYGFQAAIIVEDDLDIAPDFYEYFLGTYFLLVNDPTIWCVSAWNDNGKAHLVDSNAPDVLYRTDFFPGLGWMLTRNLWEEISDKWPKSYWDDWIRRPEQRKDRVCIRPELSRTKTFGKIGVSNGMFYEKHLKFIKLNDKYVPFPLMNLTYLLKKNYDETYVENVYSTSVVNYLDLKLNDSNIPAGPVRIQYHSRFAYKSMTRAFGLMDDFKSGVPRTGYQGIISFYFNGRRIYLTPNTRWTKYDLTWS